MRAETVTELCSGGDVIGQDTQIWFVHLPGEAAGWDDRECLARVTRAFAEFNARMRELTGDDDY
ncbi:MAG TPA: hypothetical protein VF170_13740, partial [Planctomycetaceae bacterium]